MSKILRFALGESGAATLDWAILGMSLATLIAVSLMTALGAIAVPPLARPSAAAEAPVVLPSPAGLGS